MTTVMCGGVFDLLHPGHLWFLEQAKKHGNKLVVVIARDSTVLKNKKRTPIVPENQRLTMVSQLKTVDNAILGDEKDFTTTIKRIQPQIVVLGFDQKIEENVKKYCKQENIKIVKLQEKLDGKLLNTTEIMSKILKTC